LGDEYKQSPWALLHKRAILHDSPQRLMSVIWLELVGVTVVSRAVPGDG
jgi:hypothetical protein